MFKKLGTTAMALGCAFIPFLSQVTVDGGSVVLDSSEVSSISSAMIEGSSSFVDILISLLPIILVVIILLCIRRILFKLGFFEKTAFGRWLSK